MQVAELTALPFSDRLLRLYRLLSHVVGNVRQVALVGANGGEIIGLADEIESAQRFPHLIGCRIDDRDFRSCGDIRPGAG